MSNKLRITIYQISFNAIVLIGVHFGNMSCFEILAFNHGALAVREGTTPTVVKSQFALSHYHPAAITLSVQKQYII